MRYFPKNQRAVKATLYKQIMYVGYEAQELKYAFLYEESSGQKSIQERCAEEALDVIHSAEGVLDKLDVDIDEMINSVYLKNKNRGDYLPEAMAEFEAQRGIHD